MLFEGRAAVFHINHMIFFIILTHSHLLSVDHIFPKLTRQTVGSTPQQTNEKEVLADLKSGDGINLIENKQMKELITEDQKQCTSAHRSCRYCC